VFDSLHVMLQQREIPELIQGLGQPVF